MWSQLAVAGSGLLFVAAMAVWIYVKGVDGL